jgi:hypothetical protein
MVRNPSPSGSIVTVASTLSGRQAFRSIGESQRTVDACLAKATGTAGPEAALAMLGDLPDGRLVTIAGDKPYETAAFVAPGREINVTPLCAEIGSDLRDFQQHDQPTEPGNGFVAGWRRGRSVTVGQPIMQLNILFDRYTSLDRLRAVVRHHGAGLTIAPGPPGHLHSGLRLSPVRSSQRARKGWSERLKNCPAVLSAKTSNLHGYSLQSGAIIGGLA